MALLDDELTLPLMDSAWQRVAENLGGPGVDGVTIDSFARNADSLLPELRLHALTGAYRVRPLRQILVQKKPGSSETRKLLVPTVRDRILQTAVARILSRSFEEEFLEASFAYRPDRGVDRAVARILQLRDRGYTCVVDADIHSFFDEVSHSILLKQLTVHCSGDPGMVALLKQWVKPIEWDGHRASPLRRGVPQGSPISPLFSNLFLTPLDQALASDDQKLIRYSDDFLILCRPGQPAESTLAAARTALASLGLEFNPAKTRITSFEDGFTFLGVHFRGSDASIPWKAKSGTHLGRVVALAHLMTSRELRPYRDVEPTQPSAEQPEVAAGEHSQPASPPHNSAAPASGDATEMPYLYLTQTGAVLRKSGDRFLIEHDGGILRDIPYHRLEHILVFGNIQITSQAMAEALEKNISVSLFSRQGRLRGTLTPPPGQNVMLRLKQYALHQSPAASLAAAKECIRFKIENALTVLERYEERRSGSMNEEHLRSVENSESQMTETQAKLDMAANAAELLGHEGSAAKAYFEALSHFNRSTFVWSGRRKHPATDELNALLSLGYTLVMNELSALILAHGLDPAIGFLHEIDGERPSLALDLLEPFRAPVVDRLVWTLVNRQQLQSDHFEQRRADTGMFLKAEPQRRFFEEYEKWMLTPVGGTRETSVAPTDAKAAAPTKRQCFRDLLRAEIAAFASFLRGMPQPASDGQPDPPPPPPTALWSPFSFGRL